MSAPHRSSSRKTLKKKCCRLNDNVSSNQDIVATTPPCRRRQACRLHVDEVESAEGLRQAGDDGSVALGVVVQLEQWGRHQLVVTGHRKIGFLLKVNVGGKKVYIYCMKLFLISMIRKNLVGTNFY